MNSIISTLDQLLRTNAGQLSLDQTRELLKVPSSSELTTYIYLGLKQKKIDPNFLLIAGLEHLNTRQDLIPIGLALRFGANPNGNWELKTGQQPIAIATALTFRDNKVTKEVGMTAWALLLLSGLNANQAIIQFFIDNRLMGPDLQKLFQNFSANKLPKDARNYAGILLNKKELVTSPNQDDQLLIVAVFADQLYSEVSIDYVIESLKYYNNDFFDYSLKNGAELRYASINELLIDMRKRVRAGEMALAQIRLDQLMTAIKYGTILDRYQYAFLLSAMSEKAQLVSAAYREPRWKKECRSKSRPSRELARLALGLQIEQNDKVQVCDILAKYSTTDREKLIAAARDRRAGNLVSSGELFVEQQDRDPSRSSLLSAVPVPRVCENRGSLPRDPLELPKLATVSYLSAGKLYCIPSELYETVLKTGKSPFPNASGIYEPLPVSIKSEIETNLNTLKHYNLSPAAVPSFREMLAELDKPDSINIDSTTLQEFTDLAAVNGISADRLATITPDQGSRALNVLGLSTPLAELDAQEHRIMTLAQETIPIFTNEPAQAAGFFQALNIK